MDESSGARGGFKCCSMCMRHCFEKHGDFGQQEAEQLYTSPSFSTLMKTPHISGDKKLRIPVLFLEQQNYNIGERVCFRLPLGFECECAIQRYRNGYVLQSTLNQFLVQHAIEAGDLLIFYLVAKGQFLVKVHDKFGVDKSLHTKNPITIVEAKGSSKRDAEASFTREAETSFTREAEGSFKIEAKGSYRRDLEASFKTDVEGGDVEGSDEDAVDLVCNMRRKELAKEPEAFYAPIHQYSGHKRKLPGVFRRGENEQEREQVIKSFVHAAGEKKEAERCQTEAANALIRLLKNPSQLVFMKSSHVSHSKTVYLSKLPLPNQSEVLTLIDEEGEQYTVKWTVPPDGRSRLAIGWDQFVYDHNIAIDDACLFEVTGTHQISVYIFRFVDYLTVEHQQQKHDHKDIKLSTS